MGRFQLESINVVIATKGLQDRNTNIIAGKCFYSNERPTGQKHKYNSWDDGGK